MRNLHHQYIHLVIAAIVVRIMDVVNEPNRLYIVFELAELDLKKFMDATPGPLDPKLVQVIYCLRTFRYASYFKLAYAVLYKAVASWPRLLPLNGRHAQGS